MALSKKSLSQLRAQIEQQVPYVNIKPYSHNIIGLTLQAIAEKFGQKEANKAIEDFGLDSLGWSVHEENHPKSPKSP